jgi:branched-subunit amino acid ABC-type transport system permease component
VNEALIAAIVTGIGTGSIYAIAAMGLVLTNKTSGIFNFAHGAQAAAGAFLMWELWQEVGWPWPIAMAGAVLLAGIVGGFVLERIAVALSDKSTAARVVATVGLLITVQSLIVLRYGAAAIPMDSFLPQSTFRVFDVVNVRYAQLIVAVLAAATAGALSLYFTRSREGIAMQGVVDDPALLALQGVSPIGVRRKAWLVGSCFAAVSGALLAPVLSLDATLLTLLVVQAFGAVAIGRFQSLPLTYVGGLVVGIGQEVVRYLSTQPFLADNVDSRILQPLPSNVPFLVLFVVLLVTPKAKLIERGAVIVRRDKPLAPVSRSTALVVALAAGTVLLVAPALQATKVPLFTTAAAFVLIFASLHLLVRTSGQVSLCHMAFAAIGAATFANATQAGHPFALSLIFAGLSVVPFGAFVAIPAIRLSGVYLAVATFGFGILVENLLYPLSWLFGPQLTKTASRPSFASGDDAYYYLTLAIALTGCGLVVLVRRSRLGRSLRALADSPAAVAAHGANSNVIRIMVFCISAFMAGIGGGLLGPVTGSATGVTFGFSISLILIAVLFIMGRRPVLSAVVAAGAYIVAPTYTNSANAGTYTQLIFGATAVAVACGVPGMLSTRWLGSARTAEQCGSGPTPAGARLQAVRA